MIDEKSIEDNTQKAIDKAKDEGTREQMREDAEEFGAAEMPFPSVEEMKKDFKESQEADNEMNFEAYR